MVPFLRFLFSGLLAALFLPSSLLAQESAADVAFNDANRIYEYGRLEKDYVAQHNALRSAENSYQAFLQQYPNHPGRASALYRMGVSQLLTGDNISAEENFEYVIRYYRKGHWVGASSYRLGAERFNQRLYATAARHFKLAAEEYEKPDLATQALYQYSRCLVLEKKYKEARKPLEKLANSENPFQEPCRYALGKVYFQLELFKEALPLFEQISKSQTIEINFKSEASLYEGLCMARLGETKKAISAIEKALTLPGVSSENKVLAQHEILRTYYLRGEYPSIIKQYDRGLFAGEPNLTAQNYLIAAYAFLKQENYSRAVRAFNTVEDLRPNTNEGFEASYRRLYCFYQMDGVTVPTHADTFNHIYRKYYQDSSWHMLSKLYKAESLMAKRDSHQAFKTYQSINYKQLPLSTRANFLYKRLVCAERIKQYKPVVQNANTFAAQFRNHPLYYEVIARRAQANIQLNNTAAAIEDYERIAEELPESPITAVALQGLVSIYSQQREYQKLVEAASLLIGKFPDLKREPKAHANYWLGWGHFKLEQFKKAIPALHNARSLSPDIYKEASGTRIFYSAYYLEDVESMKVAYTRVRKDVPGKFFPPKILAWLGIQCYQQEDYITSKRVLSSIVDRIRPTETPIDVWRYLSKAYLELDQYRESIDTVRHVLDREESSFWKADAYLDIAHAQLGLDNESAAIEACKNGLHYQPEGTLESAIRFTMAKAYLNSDQLDSAKNEYLIIADKFSTDRSIHPLALWHAYKILAQTDNGAASAMLNIIKEKYPAWESPSNTIE